MHELSLVQGLLGQLEKLAEENGAGKALKVKVEIGPRSGIVIDSFKFGFEVLAGESELCREAELEIISPDHTYRCSGCDALLESKTAVAPACPRCGEEKMFPEGGDQLILQQVEMK